MSKRESFEILVDGHSNLSVLKKSIEKLNKKAEKYGAAPIVLSEGKPFIKAFSVPHCSITKKYLVKPISVEYSPIIIKGEWKVIASIEKVKNSEWNVINGKIENISELKKWDMTWCDHCGAHRNRNKVIVIENSSGERKIVGRQCVVDYLGVSVKDACFCADFVEMLYRSFLDVKFDDHCEDGNFSSNFKQTRKEETVEFILDVLCGVMEKNKWHFRSQKSHEYSTSKEVQNVIQSLNAGYIYEEKGKKKPFNLNDTTTDNSKAVAKQILDSLLKEFPEDRIADLNNSFEYSFSVMLHTDTVKQINLFIGMVGYRIAKLFTQTKDDQKKKHDPKNSNYYGAIGEKVKGLTLEITNTKSFENQYSRYGASSLMVCGYIENTDNQFVTFLSGSTDFLYDDSSKLKEKIVVDATIKNHQDRGYGKQTVLVRCRESK